MDPRDACVFEELLKYPGRWTFLVHSGHVVKVSRTGAEVSAAEIRKKSAQTLALEGLFMVKCPQSESSP